MKCLILLRGLPASGKSTWIKDKGYEIYTLCPDTIRLMFAAPNPGISQEYDSQVWKLMLEILETRMKNGSFTVIDAVHSSWKSIKPYLKLCETYGYKLEIQDFSDFPLESCLMRNEIRESYKHVPETIIRSMHQKISNSQGKFDEFKRDNPETD